MEKETFEKLLESYLTGSLTPEKLIRFNEMLQLPEHRRQLEAIIDKELHEHAFEGAPDYQLLQQLQYGIDKQIQPAKTIWLNTRRVAAAAILAILLGVGSLFVLKNDKKDISITQIKQLVLDSILPGTNVAILKLADGSEILLDSAGNGQIKEQGNVKIIKIADGHLAYNNNGDNTNEVLYNTITVPRGGQYQLQLEDGTKVWINAASTLRFPTYFSGNERTVQLTGEAYFEVTKNAAMPFHVEANQLDILVLGTHFNVNAYENEGESRTTLVEGSVRISNTNSTGLLYPRQQAIAGGVGSIRVENDVDIEEVLAWKNGLFQFKSANIKAILNQAERWYNVEFEYKEITGELFSGQIQRNVNLSQLLKILESTGKVKFHIERGKIIVQS